MEHYAATGQVLGKGTHELEGYEMQGLGYFGPSEMPSFDSAFFHIPEGYADQYALAQMKAKIEAGEVPEGPEGDKIWAEFIGQLEESIKGPQDAFEAPIRG